MTELHEKLTPLTIKHVIHKTKSFF